MSTAARGRRFPLLVGTRAFRLLATMPSWLLLSSALTLLLTVSAGDLPLPWLGGVAWTLSLFAMLLCLSPVAILAQLRWVIEHARDAFECRACDIELDREGLRVHGGTSHGFHARWSDLADANAIAVTQSQLQLKPAHGPALSVELSTDPDERASLEALAASLSATALGQIADSKVVTQSPAAGHRALDLLRCPTCGAPLTPSRNRAVRCAFCNVEISMPPELASRIERSEVVDARRRADEALCSSLLSQPGPARANAVAFAGGALCIGLTAIATFLAAMMAFLFGDLGGPPHWGGIALAEFGLGLVLQAFVRGTLLSRTALRVLTLGFSALPSNHAGASATCRNCGAPLPEAAPARVLIRCVYCGADNLGSLDVGFEAEVVKRFSAGELAPSLALTRVRRRRFLTRAQGVAGVALLSAGIFWQVASARTTLAADARTATLPNLSATPNTAVEAGQGAQELVEEADIAGRVLAILPAGGAVDLIVGDAMGQAHRVRSPHGKVQEGEIAQAQPVKNGDQYSARPGSEALLVAATASLTCTEPKGPERLLYGVGTLADTLIEDPDAAGGCSGLVTTRAGKNGHFRIRQLDASGTSTLLVDARQPALAPDGRTLAFSKFSPLRGKFELALWSPGSAPRLLAHGPMHCGYATWSPDGRQIAFLSLPLEDPIQFNESTGATQLFVIDLEGHLTQLTTGSELAFVRPVWTARGIYVVKTWADETDLLRVVPR
jgi:DNA-directed RNA polymerase subunit RPC12/RpoP